MQKKTLIAVGMSGGVDSSVCAYLLKKQGYRVIGLFMKNWEEKDGSCSAEEDYQDVVKVSEEIGIDCYSINFTEEYYNRVFTQFIEDCKKGLTPNPDILCNREIKFDAFLKKAQELGADYLATGHYCQKVKKNNRWLLKKGKDQDKDQSYFLHTIDPQVLEHVLFPIGHMHKSAVKQIAKEAGLVTYEKKESMGICFIGKRKFTPFLQQYLQAQHGNFENTKKEVIGRHIGLPYYTIGQRKGIEIGGKGPAWYVVGKDIQRNVVIIEQGEDHPSLFSSSLLAKEIHWLAQKPSSFPHRCFAKIRYRQKETPCVIEELHDNRAFVRFTTPQRAITPGQSIVFYQDDICLGGSVILQRETIFDEGLSKELLHGLRY